MYEEISGQVVNNEFHKVEINIDLLFDLWREIISNTGRNVPNASAPTNNSNNTTT